MAIKRMKVLRAIHNSENIYEFKNKLGYSSNAPTLKNINEY